MWFQEEEVEQQWTLGSEVLLMSSNDIINWLTAILNQLIKQLACLKPISESYTLSLKLLLHYTLGTFKYSRPASPQNKQGILSIAVFSFILTFY